MEFVQTTAELMGLTSLMRLPVLLVAAGIVGFVLSGALARTIELVSDAATRRAARLALSPHQPDVDRPQTAATPLPGSVAAPVRVAP